MCDIKICFKIPQRFDIFGDFFMFSEFLQNCSLKFILQ